MSQSYSGLDGTVTAAGTDMDVTGFTADVEQATYDSTTTGDAGWEDVGYATQKVSGSFDFFFNTSKNPYAAPQSMLNRTPVALVLAHGGGKTLSGNAAVTKLSVKSATKEGITMTASFTSKGVWTLPT